MIRPEFDITLPDGDPHLTLRQVIDWYKAHIHPDVQPTGEEVDWMTKRWVALVTQLANEQGVPVGWMAWAIEALVAKEAIDAGGAEIFGESDDQPSGN